MRYIDRCTDKTPPKASEPHQFPFDIYFAGRSRIWNGGGTAFLDDSKKGFAFGRIYKISGRQFDEIQQKEGANYTKRVYLGKKDNLPIYTFTAERNDRQILFCLRTSEHGVSLQDLADCAGCTLTAARESAKKMRDLRLIRQDSRSIQAGSRASDREAVYYTEREMRDLIDMLLVI